jgi:hypothetical protein
VGSEDRIWHIRRRRRTLYFEETTLYFEETNPVL